MHDSRVDTTPQTQAVPFDRDEAGILSSLELVWTPAASRGITSPRPVPAGFE
jgi:hypothetical protein